MELTSEEIRVLGCLAEKAATTPDQYPLSTNALVNACNQKNSREPVVNYTERTVIGTMLLLRAAGLARTVTGGGRVEKHRHVLHEAWGLDREQLAVLAVLALRGPQTPGELRTRTERYVTFDELAEVDRVLQSLANRGEPLVADLGRAPGQSQHRWTHLLAGEPTLAHSTVTHSTLAQGDRAARGGPTDVAPSMASRSGLEARVAALETRLAKLEEALGLDPDS